MVDIKTIGNKLWQKTCKRERQRKESRTESENSTPQKSRLKYGSMLDIPQPLNDR